MQDSLRTAIASGAVSPWVLATMLAGACALGAAHALTPGHGKAVMAAYLVGARGRLRDAFYLGFVLTAAHTASVFALGAATLLASNAVPLTEIYPWLALLSGLLVMGVGASLFRSRLGGRADHHHGDGHDHPHDASHPHPHPPGKRGLLSLGVAGGIVPCPEALVVLLVSIAAGRIALGLAVLVAFSLGLAAVLIGLGVAAVLFTPVVGKFAGPSRWQLRLPLASAAVVTILGAIMTVQSLSELVGRR